MLVRALFPYPKPFFAYNSGDPNVLSAISAGELTSDLLPPERLQGKVFRDLYSPTRIPVAAPVSPA